MFRKLLALYLVFCLSFLKYNLVFSTKLVNSSNELSSEYLILEVYIVMLWVIIYQLQIVGKFVRLIDRFGDRAYMWPKCLYHFLTTVIAWIELFVFGLKIADINK